MSSESEEVFDLDDVGSGSGSDSEGYAPVSKSKAAPKAKAPPAKPKAASKAKETAKAPAKSKAAPKKKPLKSVENVEDDEDDDTMDVDNDDEDSDSDAKPKKKSTGPVRGEGKTASEMYTKLSQIEHILKRPDSYIGSVESHTQDMWVFNSDTKKMEYRSITYVPGFFKIVDEILVNAADNKINDPGMDAMKVTINAAENTISVWNNGSGIPVEIHTTEKIHIPEMIFSHLLTSSNYDDDEKKLTGGRNGYGAKLTNIYSSEFTVDTADAQRGLKYKQTFTDNMSKKGAPKITKNSSGQEYTHITFKPDLVRFGMDSIDTDTEALLMKRVYDMAGTVQDIKVSLNGERLKVKNFKTYAEMYLTAATEAASANSGGAAVVKPTLIHEKDGRFEYAFAISESGNFQHVSFANSISTTKGGTHVNLIAEQICKKLAPNIQKKNKSAQVKNAQIKNHMWLFVNALIENPTFDSQTKEQLTLTASKFGSKPVVSEDFIKKVTKSDLIDRVLNWAKFKADQQIKKTDGSKRTRLTGLTKLTDANNAGTKKGKDCTLILTEGDSAKALAEAGLSVVGRDNFGVFPLRGKLLNVREATHDQIMKNAEIQNIKQIMGLQHNKEYKETSSLRYGSLMIMTDQDHDGSHIKGLLINFLDHFYPSLLKIPSFLVEFVTPIVRVSKGNQKKNFFTVPEYLEWNEVENKDGKWSAKYYKGLGTSTNADAKEYFSDMGTHMIPFSKLEDTDRPLIDMAFSKKKADERKDWLRAFKPGTYIDHNVTEISYDDFINRELILFSMADNIRSIPSVVDGLKPGHRKIMFACFKRNLKAQVKVAQLIGYISEKTAYHHGEQSLASSIIGLAQNYVGANNINLLSPDGQYGTRWNGGKDAASPRYIFTHLPSMTRAIFHPSDDPILNYLVDDGDPVEPEWYMPVVPMVLINGAEGIGTGWSTNVPSFNPEDVVENLRRLMRGDEMTPMVPWYRGFKGTIVKHATEKDKFVVTGCVEQVNDTTVEITELPIHQWTVNYKEFLETCIIGGGPTEKEKEKDKDKEKPTRKVQERFIQDYKEHHAGRGVHFILTMSEANVTKALKTGLVAQFKLSTTLATSNMMCFDADGSIKKYTSPEQILEEFYDIRHKHYQKRKAYVVGELELQAEKLTNQARFVQMIIDKKLIVSGRKKVDIVAELRKREFRPFPKVSKAKEAGENADALDDDDEPAGATSDYDYLLGMAIWSLTNEKVEKLTRECEAKRKELEDYIGITPLQLWNTDLDAFLKEWEKIKAEDEAEERKAGASTKGKKQATLRTRKSIGGKSKKKNESDDDFEYSAKSAKAGPKTKPAAEPKPKVIKPKPKVELSDSEDDRPPPAPAKKAAPKKVVKKAESDSGAEIISAPSKAKPAAKAKAKPAPKRVKSESDSDEKPSSKGKGKAPVKRKSITEDDDDEDEMYLKPAKKAKPAKVLDDFFDKLPATEKPTQAQSKPKTKAAPATKAPPKKKPKSESEDDVEVEPDSIMDSPPPRTTGRRPARAAATQKYAMISDDEEEKSDPPDTSVYEIDSD